MQPSILITRRNLGLPLSSLNRRRTPMGPRADRRTIALRVLVWSAALLPWVAAIVILSK